MDIIEEDIEIVDQSFNEEHFNDISEILENYEELKKTYISKSRLSKYEKTKVLCVRAVQLKNNAKALIDPIPKHMTDELDIANEELKQRKIPFILERTIGNKKEYWKLEDMIY
jgi:DNA-directed RNA polymerase subunit K/omega